MASVTDASSDNDARVSNKSAEEYMGKFRQKMSGWMSEETIDDLQRLVEYKSFFVSCLHLFSPADADDYKVMYETYSTNLKNSGALTKTLQDEIESMISEVTNSMATLILQKNEALSEMYLYNFYQHYENIYGEAIVKDMIFKTDQAQIGES